MEMNKTDDWMPLSAVVDQYKLLFDQTPEYYNAMELAWMCVKKHVRYFRTKTILYSGVSEDKAVKLPPGVFTIESVTRDGRAISSLNGSVLLYTGITIPGVPGVQRGSEGEVGAALEPRWYELPSPQDYVVSGPFVDYEFRDSTIWLERDYQHVNIVFNMLMVNPEDGYPYVTSATLDACVMFIHKTEQAKRFYKKEIDINTKREAEQDFDVAAAKAREGDGFSDNAMDSILKVMTSFGRKRYDQPFRVDNGR